MAVLEPLYVALDTFKKNNYEKCVQICSDILQSNPYDQSAWTLKMRALTSQVWVDEIEAEDETLAEVLFDDNSISGVARPGTSLKTAAAMPKTAGMDGPSQAIKPRTQSGRPLSGMVRPGTQSKRPGTVDQALKAPRTAKTSRPVSAAQGRSKRIGTSSMLSLNDDFLNLSRLNLSKYATDFNLAKPLFEYIYYHENDYKKALDLASEGTKVANFKDWWWKIQLGRCYYKLNLIRDAEKQFRSSLQQNPAIDSFLLLGRVYVRLDQPLAALDVYKSGLEKFPGEVTLLTGRARIHEALNESNKSVKLYREILIHESNHVESIACIATSHFYSDQPELALRYYRRLLQFGLYNGEIFNNLGLCCFYAQQYDVTLTCFQRALGLADQDNVADVWFNISHVAVGIGDINLAYQCLRLALSTNHDHAESYNNLGILEYRRGNLETAKAFFLTASSLGSHLYQPFFNHSLLSNKSGDLQTSFLMMKKSLEIFPEHDDSIDLLKKLQAHFNML